ncbi:guanine permease [Oenococcus oeni IOEB_0607]|uniref:NCS2 family permease n=1 Tax=Oenococcus oeni TaxID=1247 RepID=UPI00050FC059|nr:NCS2 family permease [Oenococcus oeni]KGH80048.1 guanine permease [Oenococcus oeni IOEB_0607]
MFQLEKYHTNVKREVIAGFTTFLSMVYIFFLNPQILGQTGMPKKGVFLASIIVSTIGTLFMGLFANVPFALAPGIGMQAYFTYTIVFGFHFKWQQALAIVFLVGTFDLIITLTHGRRAIVKAIPVELKAAIAGGIGLFVTYIGLKNAGFINFIIDKTDVISGWGTSSMIGNGSVTPEMANFNQTPVILALIGLLILIVLCLRKVPGAFLISMILTTLIGIPMGVTNTDISWGQSLSETFSEFSKVFLASFSNQGMPTLFTNWHAFLLTLATVFAMGLTGLFDAIGTLLGIGERTQIFTKEDQREFAENRAGFKTRMDRALLADTVTTTSAGLLGTSNTTTFIESASGIAAGGRTGLSNLVTAAAFLLTIFFAPFVSVIPNAATAPILILVGISMMGEFKKIEWGDLEIAIPSFFTSVFMALSYSISYGIAAGFIFYIFVKIIKGKFKQINPVVLIISLMFLVNFILIAFRFAD